MTTVPPILAIGQLDVCQPQQDTHALVPANKLVIHTRLAVCLKEAVPMVTEIVQRTVFARIGHARISVMVLVDLTQNALLSTDKHSVNVFQDLYLVHLMLERASETARFAKQMLIVLDQLVTRVNADLLAEIPMIVSLVNSVLIACV